MKKIIYTLLATALLFSSCSNFLDTLEAPIENKGTNNEQNTPNTPNENGDSNNNNNNDNSTPNNSYNPSGNGDFYISFNLNGHGSENYKSFTGIPLGTEILFDKLPTPKNEEDWIFEGWYDDTNTKLTENFIIRRNYNLKARWRSLITEKPIYLPETTSGTDGLNSRYVLFGDWPQTIKANDVTIDETATRKINGFDCYKGSDNCYYVKKAAKLYNGNYELFSNKEIKQQGVEYYFKMEPIKWRVIDNYYQGKKQYLLFSEKYLTSSAEDYQNSNILFEKSNARTTLHEMVSQAFSQNAQNLLVPNSKLFNDKIFILSESEYNSGKYFDKTFKDDLTSYRKFSDYIIADEINIGLSRITGGEYYNTNVAYSPCFIITSKGFIGINSMYSNDISTIYNSESTCIAPAIIVNELFE